VKSFPSRPGSSSAPPLWVWCAAAAVFALLFFLSASSFWDRRYNEKPFMEDSRKRLEALSKRDKKGLRVIAIGSSLFRRGMLYDTKMEAFAKENGLEGLAFLRLTRHDSDISNYEPFFDKVIAARPDIVLIESDSLFYVRLPRDFYREYPDSLRRVLLKSLSAKSLVLPAAAAHELDSETDPPIPIEQLKASHSHEAGLRNLKQRVPADPDRVDALLRKAAEAGVRIVILDMRREPGFEKLAGINTEQAAALLKGIPEEYGVRLTSQPGELGREYYWDYAHLNEDGRLRFSLWLVSVLRGMETRL